MNDREKRIELSKFSHNIEVHWKPVNQQTINIRSILIEVDS